MQFSVFTVPMWDSESEKPAWSYAYPRGRHFKINHKLRRIIKNQIQKKRKENHWEFWLSVDWWVPCRLKITGSPKKKKIAKWFNYWTKSVKVLLGDDSPEFRSLWADLSITFPYRTIFFFTITLGPLVSQHRSVWIEFIIVEIENWKLKVL